MRVAYCDDLTSTPFRIQSSHPPGTNAAQLAVPPVRLESAVAIVGAFLLFRLLW